MRTDNLSRSVVILVLSAAGALAGARQPPAADVEKLFEAFLKAPTRENYVKVHKAVTSHEKYDGYSRDLGKIGDLVRQKKHKEAKALLEKGMPNLLLSPRAHRYGILAAEGLGDAAAVAREREAYQKCVKGILSTGDGTPGRAYIVTRVSDEYDLLRVLRKRQTQQGLVHKDGKSYDVVTCTDGTSLWFDVTAAFAAMSRRFREKAGPDKPK